jgi:AbrB family looped-hinge helix DNA binding protein
VVETVTVDDKGRLVLPKKVREEARIKANAVLLVDVKEEGRVELIDPEALMRKAREIAKVKLQGWTEEDHEATRLITEEAMRRKDAAP